MTRDDDDLPAGQLIPQRQADARKTVGFYSRWLGYAVGISFDMTTGAGGFSICPTLNVNPIISTKSPEYEGVNQLLWSMTFGHNFDDDFEALRRSLSDLRLDPARTILHDPTRAFLYDPHPDGCVPLFEVVSARYYILLAKS